MKGEEETVNGEGGGDRGGDGGGDGEGDGGATTVETLEEVSDKSIIAWASSGSSSWESDRLIISGSDSRASSGSHS